MEILVVLRNLYNNPGTNEALKAALEETYPELKEDEDEKIRKEIILFLKDASNCKTRVIDSETLAKWAAHLEKQKEPTEELSMRLNGVMQEYVKAGKDEEEQEHRLKCYQLFWDALGDSEFFKQKEQKPNVIIPKFRIGDTICLKGSMAEYTIESIDAECYHGKGWGLPISAENNYELVEQKPTEWSEEDEKMLSSFLHKIEVCDLLTNKENVWIIRKLKSLRPQPKQEWSEEEKKFIKHCAELLDEQGEPMCALRLESLRPQPHWKPSEEQMKWLKDIIKTVPMTCRQQLSLESLYNDLNGMYKTE